MPEHRSPSRLASLTSLWPDRLRPFATELLAPFRRDRRLAFGAGWLATVLVAGWGGWQVWRAEADPPAPPPALPAAVVGATTAPAAAVPGLDRSAPVKISAESIKL